MRELKKENNKKQRKDIKFKIRGNTQKVFARNLFTLNSTIFVRLFGSNGMKHMKNESNAEKHVISRDCDNSSC